MASRGNHDMTDTVSHTQDTAQLADATSGAIAPQLLGISETALREELAALAEEHAGREQAMRAALLLRFKSLVAEAREQAQKDLEADNNGRRCAENLSAFQDMLIRLIYDFATEHVYRVENPSTAERIGIVATGGYGRGLLAPGSDIDLLILLPYKQTAWGDSVVEFILYMLWDLGFKVGHAVRTVGQCLRAAQADMTIRTTLLDARHICGEATLFETFFSRFVAEIVATDRRAFIEAKLSERDERHRRSGASRYSVEPNIKEGKGGLRDLHLLHWLTRYLALGSKDGTEAEILSPEERTTFRDCEDFLWTVRCHLHFLTGRPEERLSFDVQTALAERMGYRADAGLRAVERFMRHYFLVAREVGDLTRIVCSALELKQLKATPTLQRLIGQFARRRNDGFPKSDTFVLEHGRINVTSPDVFARDPVNFIRLFVVAEKYNVLFHPDALRLVRKSLRLIDDDLRNHPAANRLFLRLLTSRGAPENALRRMNEAGVLGRFLPDFGRVVSMMQFNMYHHYTVDEHLIRAVGILSEIEKGERRDQLPLSTDIFPTLENRRVLYVAMLLHDIAKGRKEDHSEAGAKVARALCPRLGVSPSETELVAWLVAHHLDMSHFAQSRDLADPKTARDFAALVQSPERLKLLLILTVADIQAVGPGVWNGWKGELLRTLYHMTEPLLTGGHSLLPQDAKVARIKADLRARLEAEAWPDAVIEKTLSRHYSPYLLRTDPERQLAHARLMRRAEEEGLPLATETATDAFTDMTELTVFTANHPRLLAMITGACAYAGGNIVGAQITTTRDGMALDTVTLRRDFDMAEDETRRAERIVITLEKLLAGEMRLDDLAPKEAVVKGRMAAFTVEPRVVIDNTLSEDLTVIEVNGLDRPGLLFDLTREIANLSLDIASAHIATFGEKAVDVFYVTDLTKRKITSRERQARIRERLLQVLEPPVAVEAAVS